MTLKFTNVFTNLVPRTFRLYEELEKAEHAQLSDQSVSYGLNEGKLIERRLKNKVNQKIKREINF